ncbi:hypothetical protein GCM10010912_11200 [Paenibacillus albidus]|uniref:Uncharacterized protein n=1 Tax=Paenibacillus albidus TaxID=2041023 RepID=A0A917C212_9BACL|nr:hypothetical protein [Paenibacillus albidus]GGF67954.1 hypothetical protein GCM10010912_11200 [Paenibacillus albidus]
MRKMEKRSLKAAIINGSAYAPVCAVAEATGAGLTVEGKKIIMSETNTTTAANGGHKTIAELQIDRKKITGAIDQRKLNSTDLEANAIPLFEAYKQVVDKKKTEIATLQQLTEIDAKITVLLK